MLGFVSSAWAAGYSTNDWTFLDNGQIRLGVKHTSGACIGFFGLSGGTNRNLLNHHDQGRFVQQSFYGDVDGSVWDKQPWRWNPVQGGDYKGAPARLLALSVTNGVLYAKTMGRNWAGCTDLPEVAFEQWIRLTGRVAQVHYRMSYTGTNTHEKRSHEIPAVFVEPDLDTLVLYTGHQPWTGAALDRSRPGWPNEGRAMTEHWAAYVGASGCGIGACVPVATNLTCYRFGDGKPEHGACSYFAPLIQFPITPGLRWDYDVYLALGTVEEIRSAFERLPRSPAHAAPPPSKP